MQPLAKEGGGMLYIAITILAESFHNAYLSVQVELGAGLSTDLSQDCKILLYRTEIEESQPPLTSLLSHHYNQMFCLQ